MMKTANYYLQLFILFLGTVTGYGQSVIYEENFGLPTANELIQDYKGWQNKQVAYSGDGTCDIRTSSGSSGYSNASGGGNVMINNATKWFQISDLNTTNYENIQLHSGIRKGATTEDGSSLLVQTSTDGVNWSNLPAYDSLPTGSGTTGWYHITIAQLPACENLRIRFANTGSGEIRLDDLSITSSTIIEKAGFTISSPMHGQQYNHEIELSITIHHFELGEDGILKTEILNAGQTITTYINSSDALNEYLSHPIQLTPGNYSLDVSLLKPDSTSFSPEINKIILFSIIKESVAAPLFSPKGGTYYDAQTISIQCDSENTEIYYTTNGTTPNKHSARYNSPLNITKNTQIKAIAYLNATDSSAVSSASYIIRDTNAALVLPLNLTRNSLDEQLDITLINGFYPEKTGSSYADGSVKFEQSNAGKCMLTAWLDSSPDSLHFDVKGRVGGAAPQGYEGVVFTVSESPDKKTWSSICNLTETEIGTSDYHRFSYPLKSDSRYIQWKLSEAGKGNTQLNNIRIGKAIIADTTYITENDKRLISIYPNPVQSTLYIDELTDSDQKIELQNLSGTTIYMTIPKSRTERISFERFPSGIYLLCITTKDRVVVRKIIKI